MKRAFRGEITQKVDGKGRVSIPAKFCRVLEACDPDWSEGKPAQLFLVYGDKRRSFAEGYTAESMDEISAMISRLPRGTARRKALENMFYRDADDLAVDGSGRIVLPRAVRDKIAMAGEGEAVFIGNGDRFQIWNATDYASVDTAAEDAILDDLGDADITELLNDDWSGGA